MRRWHALSPTVSPAARSGPEGERRPPWLPLRDTIANAEGLEVNTIRPGSPIGETSADAEARKSAPSALPPLGKTYRNKRSREHRRPPWPPLWGSCREAAERARTTPRGQNPPYIVYHISPPFVTPNLFEFPVKIFIFHHFLSRPAFFRQNPPQPEKNCHGGSFPAAAFAAIFGDNRRFFGDNPGITFSLRAYIPFAAWVSVFHRLWTAILGILWINRIVHPPFDHPGDAAPKNPSRRPIGARPAPFGRIWRFSAPGA